MTWFQWAGIFFLLALAVIMFVVFPAVMARRSDRRVYEDFEPVAWEESPAPPTLVCSSCGEAGPPETMRSVITEDMFRRVIHAGGCPRDRKRLRRSPEA